MNKMKRQPLRVAFFVVLKICMLRFCTQKKCKVVFMNE